MGCCGQREKFDNPDNEQKWDYINLSDFHSSSCLTPLSYGVLYIFLLISIAVYAVDLFTCANLLFFDKWSGQVKPVIPFETSRWIFSGAIILSYILLGFRWWSAIRAMKSGVVAASYLDPLAVRVQSIRMGATGRGWRRFLVFAELTKGRKGAEYVALFTYFSFEAWLRICFAEGPRQIINALTLYSVLSADLEPTGKHAAKDGHTPVVQFFVNVQILANKNQEQAVILFGMLFTLIIWIFSALSLLLAVVFYITFLWHHIRDGSLSRYCRRKIDTRLHKIVMVKVNKALQNDTRVKAKHDGRDLRTGTIQNDVKRQPTLPILDHVDPPAPNSSTAQNTQTNNPSGSPPNHAPIGPSATMLREPTVPDVLSSTLRPLPPSRSTTNSSFQSTRTFKDDTPLIRSAAPPGYGDSNPRKPPSRTQSDRTMFAARNPAFNRNDTMQGSQLCHDSSVTPLQSDNRGRIEPGDRMIPEFYPPQTQGHWPIYASRLDDQAEEYTSRFPGVRRDMNQEYEMQFRAPPAARNCPTPGYSQYTAFKPNIENSRPTVTMSTRFPPSGGRPTRNLTQPHRQPHNAYFGTKALPQRSGTAPIPATACDTRFDYSNRGPQQHMQVGHDSYRSTTAGPRSHRQMGPIGQRY